MPQNPTPIYANVVNFRVTPTELVLDFGAHFPAQPNQPPPSDFGPEVRVVLPVQAIRGLAQALSRAAEDQQRRQPAPQPTKPNPPGFQPTKPSEPKG